MLKFFWKKITKKNTKDKKVKERSKLRSKVFSLLLLVFSISIFLIVAHYSYKYTIRPVKLDDVEIIKKSPNPLRVKPIDAGGQKFSNQNRKIYETIQSDTSSTKPKKKNIKRKPTKQKSVKKQNVKKNTKNIQNKVPKNPFEILSKGTKKFKLRLATLNSLKEANIEWLRLKKKYQIKQAKHHIEKITVRGSNKYVLYIKNLETRKKGKELCAKLNLKAQSCIIIQ